jgi:hypothetical protein
MNPSGIATAPMRLSSPNRPGSRPINGTRARERPRRIADLRVARGAPVTADTAIDAHSSDHWIATARDAGTAQRAPAHVQTLAREFGVDAGFAWAALDRAYR